MPKHIVYGEGDREQQIVWRLVSCSDGVYLAAQDVDSRYLLQIRNDGTVRRLMSFNEELGMKLDDEGRVVISD